MVQFTGKDSLQDIREGRLSVPLFLLRQRASEEEWQRVERLLLSAALARARMSVWRGPGARASGGFPPLRPFPLLSRAY